MNGIFIFATIASGVWAVASHHLWGHWGGGLSGYGLSLLAGYMIGTASGLYVVMMLYLYRSFSKPR